MRKRGSNMYELMEKNVLYQQKSNGIIHIEYPVQNKVHAKMVISNKMVNALSSDIQKMSRIMTKTIIRGILVDGKR